MRIGYALDDNKNPLNAFNPLSLKLHDNYMVDYMVISVFL